MPFGLKGMSFYVQHISLVGPSYSEKGKYSVVVDITESAFNAAISWTLLVEASKRTSLACCV